MPPKEQRARVIPSLFNVKRKREVRTDTELPNGCSVLYQRWVAGRFKLEAEATNTAEKTTLSSWITHQSYLRGLKGQQNKPTAHHLKFCRHFDIVYNDDNKKTPNCRQTLSDLRQKAHHSQQSAVHIFSVQEAGIQRFAREVQNMNTLIRVCHLVVQAAKENKAVGPHVRSSLEQEAAFTGSVRKSLEGAFNMTSNDLLRKLTASMAAVVRADVAAQIKTARYACLLADEAQDVEKKAQYAVFFHLIAPDGSAKDVFWKIAPNTFPSSKSSDIFKLVEEMTAELVSVRKKVVCICLDGANSMKGHISGLQTLLRARWCPFALFVWCQGHKLNLICIEACRSFPVLAESEALVSSIYGTFYRGRGDGKNKLKGFREAVDAASALDGFGFWRKQELVEVGTTRWLSHERCCATIVAVLRGVYIGIFAMEEESVMAKLKNKDVVMGIVLFATATPILSRFSRALQKMDRFFSQVFPLRAHYVAELKRLATNTSLFPSYHNAHLVINAAAVGHVVPEGEDWMNHGDVISFHERIGKNYVLKLISCIENDMGMNPRLASFSLFDPKSAHLRNLPEEIDDTTPLVECEAHLSAIIEHFQETKLFPKCGREGEDVESSTPFLSDTAAADLRNELRGALREIKSRKCTEYSDVVNLFVTDPVLKMQFPQTTDLCWIIGTLAMSTCSVERVFSILKLLKTRLRKQLHDSTLNDIMTLSYFSGYTRDKGISPSFMRAFYEAWTTADRKLDFCTWDRYVQVQERIAAMRTHLKNDRTVLKEAFQTSWA